MPETNVDTANLVKGIIGSLVRAALGGFTVWLATHGLITESQSGALLEAAVVGAITVVWAIWRKYSIQKRIAVALALPANASPEQLDNAVKIS
jgi:uncharacterized membrane protein YeaQ/YmgE (transglycosylase-associated protein family)